MSTAQDLKSRAEQFRQQAQQLNTQAEAIEKGLALGDDTINLLMQFVVPETTQMVANRPKVGRPSNKTAAKPAKAEKPAKTEPKAESKVRGPRTQPSLKSMILDILKTKNEGLTLAEIVQEVLSKGYKSSAKNFAIVVYQNLYQLGQKDTVGHNAESHKYSLTSKAA